MQFPELSKELVGLLEEDQQDVKAHSRLHKSNPLKEVMDKSLRDVRARAEKRVNRMLAILGEIGIPTESKIGWQGIEAITVIALHAKHSVMKKVLELLQQAPKNEIDISLLPALIDRVRILDGKKQIFGTQWFMGFQPKPYLYPVEDFNKMNLKRKEYGLHKARKPRDLSSASSPAKPSLAVESDQHFPSRAEIDHDLSSLYG